MSLFSHLLQQHDLQTKPRLVCTMLVSVHMHIRCPMLPIRRKYATSWESYRAHSILLTGKRYRGLRKHGKDYKKWAHGLKKAGYATDRRYAEKLIHIIEELNLSQYDS